MTQNHLSSRTCGFESRPRYHWTESVGPRWHCRDVHPIDVVRRAERLFPTEQTTREIARELGLPETTVGHWRRRERRAGGARARPPTCPRCDHVTLASTSYAYLLGCYLGDGHVTSGSRTACLWIYCADDWPVVRTEVETAMSRVMPSSSVSTVPRQGCTAVKSFTVHWTCLFPQHGPGTKHTRRIALEPWQQEVVEQHTGLFLRGLFHSDGCRITNWATRRVAGEVKRYEYPRYFFSNKSLDILDLCAAGLDRLGIDHRRPRPDTISVARRAAVAALDEHVGPKS